MGVPAARGIPFALPLGAMRSGRCSPRPAAKPALGMGPDGCPPLLPCHACFLHEVNLVITEQLAQRPAKGSGKLCQLGWSGLCLLEHSNCGSIMALSATFLTLCPRHRTYPGPSKWM